MDKVIKLLMIVSFNFICILEVDAATITVGPSDCSASAVNSAISSASDGDTVELTCTGTVNWTTTVSIPNTKGISLKGPGINTPAVDSGTAPASFTLTITSSASTAISIRSGVGKQVNRVTGFKFANKSGGAVIALDGQGRGPSPNFYGAYRIDNNYFDQTSASSTIEYIATDGELTGLVDNNTFNEGHTDNYTLRVRELFRPAGNTCWGIDGWLRPFNYGDSRFHFIENNVFRNITTYQRHHIAADLGGAKYVARYNIFNIQTSGSPALIEAHGHCLCNGNGAGTRGGEVYGNTINGTSSSIWVNIGQRGGHWLIYNNTTQTLGSSNALIRFFEYRASTVDCSQCGARSDCTTLPTCVTNSPSFYPTFGQIQNSYVWNNIYSGSNQCPVVDQQDYVPFYVQLNRDFFCSTSKPAALASYTPFTYPHPLRSAIVDNPPGPPAPPQLQVQ